MSDYQVEALLRPTKELVPHMPLIALAELAACWRKAPECEPLFRNVDRVAFVSPLPGAAKRRRKIRVFFAPAGSSGSPVSIFLDRDDSNALIETLSKLGLDVTALRRAMVARK